ncbi:MAG TPA: hypothetical protein ENN61_00575 [Bacteroidaceae bacterium]|nr:hypothetical protein [Bacteroidaceae bacterium]
MNYTGITGLLFLTFVLTAPAVISQDRKDIRDHNVKSQVVYEYFLGEGYNEPVIEQKQTFDENGEVTEVVQYNRKGEITLWEKYKYDEDRNVIEETILDSKGNVVKTEKTIFEDGLRVERQFYDNRGRLYKKKVYEYEYRK